MGSIKKFRKKRQELKERKLVFKDNLNNNGLTVAMGEAKYLGGHPDLLGEKAGTITVKSIGVFFQIKLNNNFIFIPIEKIVKAEFKTGEQVSKNEALSRILAYSGFAFAFKKKSRVRLQYLTITYQENDIEISVLFESKFANKFASSITQILQDFEKGKKVKNDISSIQLMKEISELKAMSIITEDEFNEKKAELLSRI